MADIDIDRMDDKALAEARRRIAERIAFARYSGTAPAGDWELRAADAVLGLFPDVTIELLLAGDGWALPAAAGDPANALQLVLRGPVEPVTEEPTP